MWRLGWIVLAASFCMAQTLSIRVTETKSLRSQWRGQQTVVCTSDESLATCTAVSGTANVTNLIQVAYGSDGNLYELECQRGVLASALTGGAMAGGAETTVGCQFMPGDYRAAFGKRGIQVMYIDAKGRARHVNMRILSVRKDK